ncbi:dTMP kinase [Krasilnikovia sp. M28-CT-15]|uniref:dTMP kinase n=1 Tax=Krasilnikovia sp. M28-CT-15 TaxID=3373540 RepID=UPI0038766603
MVTDLVLTRRRRLRTVALVGIDGSGKTTQARLLAQALRAQGLPATYRRNAGGRRWFGRLAAAFGRRDAEALLGRRLMLAVESLLRWLAILDTRLRRRVTGDISVMDRYAVCQYASLRARGASPRAERRARLAYRVFPRPDVTFLLTVDPAVAYERIEARGYDHEEMAFLRAAADAYRSLPEHDDFVVIDANRSPDEVAAALSAALDAWQNRPGPAPAPRLPAVVAGTRAVVLAAGPLAAGAAAVGHQLTDVL